jgi:peptidoglycan/xylan/chitin deacetylase (PgdA/CDA1 family)
MASGARVENAMVITFDDGYANNYEFGLPLLEKMGLPFTVFVTTGFLDSGRVLWNDLLEFAVFSTKRKVIPARALPHDIGIADHAERVAAIAAIKDHLKRKPLEEAASQVDALCEDLDADRGSARLADVRFMSRDQILRMSQSGVAIGGHGVTHSILSRESADRARAEVVDSKAALEAITGKPVVIFAYPNGQREDFSAAVKADLIEAGYRAAFTTIHGLHRPGDDLYEIKRISLDNRWSYLEFETRVSGVVKALRR